MANWKINVETILEKEMLRSGDKFLLKVTIVSDKKANIPKLTALFCSVERYPNPEPPMVTGLISGIMAKTHLTKEIHLEQQVLRDKGKEEAGYSNTYLTEFTIPEKYLPTHEGKDFSHHLMIKVIEGDLGAPVILFEESIPVGIMPPQQQFQAVMTTGHSNNYVMQLWLPRQVWIEGEQITGKLQLSAVKQPIKNFSVLVRFERIESPLKGKPDGHLYEIDFDIPPAKVIDNLNMSLGEKQEFSFSITVPAKPNRPTYISEHGKVEWNLIALASKGLRSVACRQNIKIYSDKPDDWGSPTTEQVVDWTTPGEQRTTKKCPKCAEEILLEALGCRYCGHQFSESDVQTAVEVAQERTDELDQSDKYYYQKGLRFQQAGQLDSAKLEFAKALQVSSPQSKWYKSAQARLAEIQRDAPETQDAAAPSPPRPLTQPAPSDERLTKKCPKCAEEILLDASVCRFCGHKFSEKDIEAAKQLSQDQALEAEKINQEKIEIEKLKKNKKAKRTRSFISIVLGGLLSIVGSCLGLIIIYGELSGTSTGDTQTSLFALGCFSLPFLLIGIPMVIIGFRTLRNRSSNSEQG